MSRVRSKTAAPTPTATMRSRSWRHMLVLLAVIGVPAPSAHAQLTLGPPILLGPPGLTSLGQGGITAARAANGRVLVVWSDNRTGDHDVYGALFSPNGALIGFPNGFKIAGSPGTNEGDPRVAACGNRFLVVWGNGIGDGDTTDLFATRVNTNGVVLDASPIIISNQPGVQHNQRQPSSDDVDTFIVPFRTASDSIYGGINTMRVQASTGATLDPPGGVVVAKGVDAQGLKKNASTSFGAGRFLITWDDERDRSAYPGEGIDIFGAFIDPATGAMIGQPFATTRAYSCQEGSRSAFDGVNFLVAHTDERLTNCVTADVYAERVTPAGVVLDQVDRTAFARLGCTHLKDRPDRLDGATTTPDDLSGVRAGHPHLVHRQATALDGSHGDGRWVIDQLLDHKLEEGLHGDGTMESDGRRSEGGRIGAQAEMAASLADFLMKEATVSLGWAPTPTQ